MAALGEEREYVAAEGAADGQVFFQGIDGDFNAQADHVINTLVPDLQRRNIPLHEIGVLYRTAAHGHPIAVAALAAGVPIVRADSASLVRRSSRLSRWIEASAAWVAGGWKDANPRFQRLVREAITFVFGAGASVEEREELEYELIIFLRRSIEELPTTNSWLKSLRDDLIRPWQTRARTVGEDWDAVDEMITHTEPMSATGDLSLAHFSGRIEGSGRLNLSTLHSAKGREFDAVILFAMDNDTMPNNQDRRLAANLREARRLFYVGVTRARKELYLVFTKDQNSQWVYDLYDRIREN
jgi:DNA helicase II / ATP-dependent DNA helicase PcrA